MNKINIITDETENLEGYHNIDLKTLSQITNGTCDEIICTILDKLNYTDRINTVALLCRKIVDGGSLTLKFINGSKICKDCAKGNMSTQSLSNIIDKSKSMFLESDIIELVSQTEGININKIFNDNISLMVVLQKKL